MTPPRVEHLDVGTYTVPTPHPESDGTLEWDATTAVVVSVRSADCVGWGWTYSSPAAATVITEHLAGAVIGGRSCDVSAAWQAMHRACRNYGARGLIMQAISAVDIALWDVTAQLRGQPLTRIFGQNRSAAKIYGSGGFTNLDDDELGRQVEQWSRMGCAAMKIKIGQDRGGNIGRDLMRVNRFRELAGEDVELMVDANGAYTRGQARRVGAQLDHLGVRWFEEPVSSDDVDGLASLRAVVRCDIAAGEYISDGYDARRLIPAVDCLQLDVTRCGGYTGWLAAAAVAAGHNLQVSAHCAPALHAPVAAAVPNFRHIEYFVDHARLEPLLFDGVPGPVRGALPPQTDVAGHGMTLADTAARYRVN